MQNTREGPESWVMRVLMGNTGNGMVEVWSICDFGQQHGNETEEESPRCPVHQ